jgi:MSHA biogenesis protein MshM
MYYQHFGLAKPPFKITPDTAFFYSGGNRGSVLDALSYVVLSGEGITKVIGEVGSGKTMLCRMLEERLPEHVETIYIANPSISPENILNVIAFEAGVIKEPQSKLEVMQKLQAWLLQKFTENRRVVVLIEEAQGMPLETLEELRLLSNLETEQDKLLQIVLFGQPELDENLAQTSIRQLRERITHGFYLYPFGRDQICEYLNFRVRNAGYYGPDLFDRRLAALIGRYSKGLVRRANILADKIMLAAYAEGTTSLRPRHARKAVADSQFGQHGLQQWKFWGIAAAGLLMGICLVSLLWWLQQKAQLQTSALRQPTSSVDQYSFKNTARRVLAIEGAGGSVTFRTGAMTGVVTEC